MSSQPWQESETLHLLATYNRMLRLQTRGMLGPARSKGQISKAEIVREFIALHAPTRNKQSIECKLMNVSHARAIAGLPIVIGYKPLRNCSTDLIRLFNSDLAAATTPSF
jgi:hypothetical protein